MATLKISKIIKWDISYNPNVPSYSAKYQLSNDDYNIRTIKKKI